MRKIIAAFNTTIDNICDHTAGVPDEEIHDHYTQLLDQGECILYGRETFQLMTFWKTILETPSDDKAMNDFAIAINKIPKIVFSNTLRETDWETATLSDRALKDVVLDLKQGEGKPVYIGSRSLILQLTKLNLIDEYQICVHPVIAGSGKPLFDHTNERMVLDLIKTKVFKGGAVILYYTKK